MEYPPRPDLETSIPRRKRPKKTRGGNNEQYGSKETRKPYLEASIGRLVLSEELNDLTGRIASRVQLAIVPKPALIYLPGNELAAKTKFGTIRSGLPRMTPLETVNLALKSLQRNNILTKSSKENVDAPLTKLSTTHVGNTGFRLLAILGDIPTNEYPATGQLLAENATILRAFGSRQKDRQKPNPVHYVSLGTGRLEEYDNVLEAITDNPVSDDTTVTLGKVGYVHTPQDAQ